jgi:hypothetical protein
MARGHPHITSRMINADVPHVRVSALTLNTRRDHWHRLKAAVSTVISHKCPHAEQNHPCVPSSSNVASVGRVFVAWHFGWTQASEKGQESEGGSQACSTSVGQPTS